MRKIFSLCTFAALFFLFSANVVFAATWNWIGSNDEIDYFFDKDTIRYELKSNREINEKKIIVWEKEVFTQATAQEADSNRKISYILFLKTYDLTDRTYVTHEMVFYNRDNKIIWHEKFENTEKKSIIPDSLGERVLATICDYALWHHDEFVEHTLGN